jgi:phage gp45-like
MHRRYPEGQEGVIGSLRRVALVKVDDSGPQQFADLTGLASEQFKKIVRLQPHGFASNPPAKSEGVALALGGRSDRAMVLGLEDPNTRQRNVPVGCGVLYDDKGNVIYAKGSAGVAVNAKTGEVEIRSQADKVWVKPGAGKFVFLGGDGTDGDYDFVLTVSGPSSNVKAKK